MNSYLNSMPYNMIHLCLDEWCEQQVGNAYNSTLKKPIVFYDIMDCILQMDHVFSCNGNPQASQVKRSFDCKHIQECYQNKPYTYVNYHQYHQYSGKIGTFDIVVKSRRESTWQGVLFYGDKSESFTNILELIYKIERYLSI